MWTVIVADISDETRMRGLEWPTFVIDGHYRCVTTGLQAAITAVEICSAVHTRPGVYRVHVTAPDGYGLEHGGTWTGHVGAHGNKAVMTRWTLLEDITPGDTVMVDGVSETITGVNGRRYTLASGHEHTVTSSGLQRWEQ